MERSLTEIVVLVDRSGSMEPIRDDAIGGFNAFLAEQREGPGEALLTYVQFDDEVEAVHSRRPIETVPPLDRETFVPRGTTALLDAWGGTMEAVEAAIDRMPEPERPARVLFVVLTDGAENASRAYSHDEVLALVARLRDERGWTFLFLGADAVSVEQARDLGVPASGVVSFDRSSEGTLDAFVAMTEAVTHVRTLPLDLPDPDDDAS